MLIPLLHWLTAVPPLAAPAAPAAKNAFSAVALAALLVVSAVLILALGSLALLAMARGRRLRRAAQRPVKPPRIADAWAEAGRRVNPIAMEPDETPGRGPRKRPDGPESPDDTGHPNHPVPGDE